MWEIAHMFGNIKKEAYVQDFSSGALVLFPRSKIEECILDMCQL